MQVGGRPASVGGAPVNWTSSAGDEEAVRRDELRRRRRLTAINCGKRVVAFLFSHVGLAAMVVAYSILGGFLFRALEAPHEQRVKVSTYSTLFIIQ